MSLSTHVLDAVAGRPASGIAVTVEVSGNAGWAAVASGTTDSDGRISGLLTSDQMQAGSYRIGFDTSGCFGGECFYPEVQITFVVRDPQSHHHVPLLLSPYAYSTYRGS